MVPTKTNEGLNGVEEGLISFFVDGVRMIGLPPSVGQIYGLLFASPEPLALDDFVRKLSISKGSASQGLRGLRQLGAVREVAGPDERRTYFRAETQLKKLVGGFISEEIQPHLDSGRTKARGLQELLPQVESEELRDFYDGQIDQANRWMARARLVLPILKKVLGE